MVAVMDWATRKVLAWRLSNTMDAGFCVATLAEALAFFGKPEILNTDQGSQFTSFAFTSDPTQAWPGVPQQRLIGGAAHQIMGGMPYDLMSRMAA